MLTLPQSCLPSVPMLLLQKRKGNESQSPCHWWLLALPRVGASMAAPLSLENKTKAEVIHPTEHQMVTQDRKPKPQPSAWLLQALPPILFLPWDRNSVRRGGCEKCSEENCLADKEMRQVKQPTYLQCQKPFGQPGFCAQTTVQKPKER